MKHILKLTIGFFVVAIGFSCEDTNHEPLKENATVEVHSPFDLPKNVNGVLKFYSQESLDFWSNKVNAMSSSDFKNWQEKIGYESIEELFNDLVDAENKSSDSLTTVYSLTNILPKKIHLELPIHSTEVIPHLEKLYFFEGGGFFPVVSLLEPKITKLLNSKSQIYIGEDFIEFKKNGKFINKKKVQSLDGINLATITTNSYIDRLDKIKGDFRTITDISYYVNEQSIGVSGEGTKSATVSGFIEVRNFRKGFFGWNTRNTTSLRIQGNLNYHLYACGISNGAVLPPPNFPYSYSNLNLTTNGQNTTSLGFNFTSPTAGIQRTNTGCTSIPFGWNLGHQLIITGEGDNVAYFNNY
jgi:hypothetical protein